VGHAEVRHNFYHGCQKNAENLERGRWRVFEIIIAPAKFSCGIIKKKMKEKERGLECSMACKLLLF
jgi:hypothetical protein